MQTDIPTLAVTAALPTQTAAQSLSMSGARGWSGAAASLNQKGVTRRFDRSLGCEAHGR